MIITPECVAPTGCLTGQSPVWNAAENRLWWVDQKRAKLHRYNPLTGNTRRYELPVRPSRIALWGGLILMAADREIGVFDPAVELYERITVIAGEPVTNRTGDGGIAPDGTFWFATEDEQEREPSGAYYRYSLDKTISPLRLPSVLSARTFEFSPDGRTFYTCDAAEYEVLAHDYDPATGAITGRRTFAFTHELGGMPYGAAVDAEGGVWVCLHGASRVVRFTPQGDVDEVIILAAPLPTGCAFGGEELRTLFITTARHGLSFPQLDARPLSGSLFAIRVDVPGLPARHFGG
jgi:sugar lactone lactonase YvrE